MFFSLRYTLDQKHPLFILAEKINWDQFEEAMNGLYFRRQIWKYKLSWMINKKIWT